MGQRGDKMAPVLPRILFTLVLLIATSVATLTSRSRDQCHTLQTDVSLTKEKFHELNNGRRVRLLCTAEISINKCEGYCTSRVSPSVVQYPGFKKDCKCCRESTLHNRLVRLSRCYDGTTLVPGQFTNMFIREPVNCACSNCEI